MNLSVSSLSSKWIYIAAGIVVILLVAYAVLSLRSGSTNKKIANTSNNTQLNVAGNLSPTPTFTPPKDFSYTTVESVNFLPHSINGYTINQDAVQKSAKQLFPNLSDEDLIQQINTRIFNWLALNEFYSTNDSSKVSKDYNVTTITNILPIEKELQAMQREYNAKTIVIDGLYLKLRFNGTLPKNQEKLKLSGAQLQPVALQLIQRYKQEGEKNKDTVLENFNRNNTVLLLNNRESSKAFNNVQLFPPIVGDSNYYAMMQSLPVGTFSDVITLKSDIGGTGSIKEYAYAVFYISRKTGEYLPLEALANSFVEKAEIQ